MSGKFVCKLFGHDWSWRSAPPEIGSPPVEYHVCERCGVSDNEDRAPASKGVIEIDDIARLALKPGDVLVVKVARPITSEMHDHIGKVFADNTPDGVKIMVIGPEITLSVLSKDAA